MNELTTPESHAPATAAEQPIITYKGFDANWKCRDQQYVVGQSYEMDGPIAACERGFHACEHPLDVLSYYPPAGSRFAIVEQSGELGRHHGDTKVASSRISIKAEIDLPGLIKAAIEYTFSRAKPVDPESPASATGYSGAASATGDYGAASATGYSGAASATGDYGAASATGKHGAAMASGRAGRAQGAAGCAIFLVERNIDWEIVAVFAGIAGRDGIKPDTWYTLQDGKPVEVEGH